MNAKKVLVVSFPGMLAVFSLILSGCCNPDEKNDLQSISQQFSILLKNSNEAFPKHQGDSSLCFFPRSLTGNGQVHYVTSSDWCSGFFPGCLWLMAELCPSDSMWRKEAEKYTALIEREKWNDSTHDMGFKIMCSFGNGLKNTGKQNYREVIMQAAGTLISRYNPKVGCIRSWDFNDDQWKFPVIIDNMMNLELLFKATELSGDSVYYKIAKSHAETTLKNHFRNDYSSYHVVDYDPSSGEVIKKFTFQGDTDESAWSRGQAWALYGYTMVARKTNDPQFLNQALKIAAFIIDNPNLPSDRIPVWDFNYSEKSGEPRDVSAASVIASALFELAAMAPGKNERFSEFAADIVETLKNKYASRPGTNKGFILDHSVGFRHRNQEVDVPIIYADYYFLEALVRETSPNQKSY